MDFGWYEVVMMIVVLLAHLHGIYEGKKQSLERGVEATLHMLEKEGIIKVEDDGEITAVCKDS